MEKEKLTLIRQLEQSKYNATSLSELEVLATKLLTISQKTNDSYAATVAYYSFACLYYQCGNTAQCLSNASMCNELSNSNEYTDYYIDSCNLIGIVYVAMSEQFLALDYYLKGLYAAKNAKLYHSVCRLLNNIGDMFQNLGVYEEALLYFKKAKACYEEHALEECNTYAIIVMNIIECDLLLGKEIEAKKAILEISGLLKKEDSVILNCILLSNEIVFYAKQHNYEKAKHLITTLLEDVKHHHEFSHTFTALLRIRHAIYQLRDREIGNRYVQALRMIVDSVDDLNYHIRFQEAVIEYYSVMEDKEQWQNAIAEYYYYNEQNNKIRKENYYNSLIAKVQLEEILQEQAEMLRQKKELETLSEIDGLTQIYNRRAVEKRIREKLSSPVYNGVCALILMDLDHFKEVNDTYGHIVGDLVLSNIGILLKQGFREQDIVGRLGGDEFIILMYGVHKDRKTAEQILKNRVDSLLYHIRNMQFENHPFRITSSIGIRLIEDYSVPFTTLYNDADTALYKAKKAGRDQFAFYT